MTKTKFDTINNGKTLLVERVFEVSRDKLWKAHTEQKMFKQWFAPTGWEVSCKKFEFKEGGENIYVMKCTDKSQGEWYGQLSIGKMIFNNIVDGESFEYQDYFLDDNMNVNSDMPVSRSNMKLEKIDDNTTKLIVKTTYESKQALDEVLNMGMQEGYIMTLDKIENLVSKI